MNRTAAVAASGATAWIAAHVSSPAVRGWHGTELPLMRFGPLAYRAVGHPDAPIGVLLLHGLVATGDVFGRTPHLLGASHRVVVPDLLGFGASMDERRSDFGTEAHLGALNGLIEHELGDRPFRIGAHSMGSALALRLAAEHPTRVDRVVCIGAPIWASPAEARAGLGALGPMARALILDRRVASRLCRFNCRHRRIAGLLAAATSPRWPIPVARQASLHTWEAYIQALEEQIIDCPWPALVERASAGGCRIELVHGRRDPIGDRGAITALTRHGAVTQRTVEGDHGLPAADPTLLHELLGRSSSIPQGGRR